MTIHINEPVMGEVEVTVDGETFTETVRIGHIVQATPNRGSFPRYARLHLNGVGTWKWNASLEDLDESTVETDPASESRWVEE